MIILNVTSCDFLIYSNDDNNYHVIPVKLNNIFCKKLLFDLKVIYFEKLIREL